ncbi:hypothetical protein CPC16_003799 [Podila verticillata]|nr:hypothetical protein CPC16_003799 [Podila verticillata]
MFTEQFNAPVHFESDNTSKPKVLIAGGGIGGLTLGILLNKAGVPFKIFERNYDVKQLGSAIAVGTNAMPLFKQLGIYDEFVKLAKPTTQVHVITDELDPVYTMDFGFLEELTTYESYIIPRPDLYDLLLRQVPEENIYTGKTVYNFDQDKKSVLVRFADATKHYCDILVGADGAYSKVRKTLYRSLEAENKLPASDNAPLPFKAVCLVGETGPLDPEEFPDLKDELCKDYSIVGTKNMYTWCTFTTKKNTLCWMVIEFLDKEVSREDDSDHYSEWGPQAAEEMCNKVRDFNVPGGKDGKVHTLGDLIDKTPKELISKVLLEEKLFNTWYHGRVVLLGDACHKLVPSSGQGGVSAMHDAIALANWIVSLESPSMVDVENAFKEYHAERFPIAKDEFDTSQGFTDILGKGYRSTLTRFVLGWLPASVFRKIIIKMSLVRPQASFLPLIEDKGTLEKVPQPSLIKTLPILEARALSKARAAKRPDYSVAAV